MHTFADNTAVVDTLNELIERSGEPLVIKMPRTAGRKDSEYMHLFSGEIDIETLRAQAETVQQTKVSERTSMSELAQRVSDLEAEVHALKTQLSDLTVK